MKRIKVGISPCPNDVFIFSGLLLNKIPTPGYKLLWDLKDVETLNNYSELGIYDILKISAAQWGQVQNKGYTLLHCGGAMGYGCGPLLLWNKNSSNEVKKFPILIPGERTTAHFLYQFYKNNCKESQSSQENSPKQFLLFDEVYQRLCQNEGQQGVVIHECRFTYERDGLNCVVDLGKYWETKTGFPIPLGVLITQEQMENSNLEKGDNVSFSSKVEKWIRSSLQWAYENKREALDLCKQYAQEMSDEVMEQHIQLYVNSYTEDIGEEGLRAIEHLLKYK